MALTPDVLHLLGYPNEWLDFGLLEEDFVRSQLATYRQGEDRSTEHYRFAAFRALRNQAAVRLRRG